ncbi:MAG TPA: DUF4190 domain-containing protein [Tepidisphaeraceae bacterium]
MIYFQCKLCHTQLSAQDEQADQQVRCPNCMAAVTVPAAAREAVAVTSVAATSGAAEGSAADSGEIAIAPPKPRPAPPAVPPRRPPTQYGKRYGFNCVYCSSRLEATETMAGHEGQCPTCGNAIVIPILDRYGRLIDPVTKQIIKQDPHPVHAYAAAGERAPAIIRTEDGKQQIVCNKCRRPSPITANNCKNCGMPFTMEGTAPEAGGGGSGFATASLVLGIIGVPFGCTVIVPLLAIVFGCVALSRGGEANAGRGQAIAGIVCGVVGLGIAVLVYLN